MLKAARHDAIVELLRDRPAMRTADIAQKLHVSLATVRRDSIALESQGVVERSWGGIQLVTGVDDHFGDVMNHRSQAKDAIARRTAELVHDGDTVIMDIGTTVHHLTGLLAGRDITVLTASFPVFEALRSDPDVTVVVLGGTWSERYQCFDGQFVADALTHHQADLAFLGCSGVAPNGRVRDTSRTQAHIKQAVVSAASRSYLLADSEKFPGTGAHSPFTIDEVTGIITAGPSPADIDAYCASTGMEVITA
ncbi:MAG: DeoR/GlpR family DNA-binding transcription regulator [Cutibacterium granulosum]|uniref:DeoR/GlpR family DNA-binding transcription regulator n=1 Tax=Cutibacterium granulosum TaxID=33011 RepID=UPI002B232E85|nr:DeoR/GlpR family DNA-binding transcription regulator [Cutibacterium granulosum]MEA5648811.1 DeoR/GlpR family DNA-binding transcription regulator [Cutibacterium granulosum]MEA5653712.1 DeoR/GlpR family DNA-binding transcription regulator [Cutibacterium granulosum]MEA5663421.1 DeoR/GlpR family DNA-binding transcription regulator [Cutibacterium granulosum]MEA5665638.1 DeoR/GlpR family DNA-binding transcription regulator [Cutibacterium granulosum]